MSNVIAIPPQAGEAKKVARFLFLFFEDQWQISSTDFSIVEKSMGLFSYGLLPGGD
jgi:hypothetical protein